MSSTADRSVTVRLDADIKPFVTAMARAEAAAKSLRDSLGKAASININADTSAATARIQQLQREVDRLNGTRATVRADVDAAQAQAQVAELRRRLEELSSRRIGVDLDAGAARSELSSIQRDLERLNATSADPKVRVDSAAALAQLRAVQSQMSSVSGKSARVKVDADIGGALAGIATVAAALAALPSAVSIGVGVAGLGAAFGVAAVGAAGFASVAIPSLGRINDALKQAETASGGAGGAIKSAGQKAAEAAASALRLAEAQDRVKDSAQAVKQAQQSVRDAVSDVRSAQQDAARAAEDAADRQAQAAARIADAERSVQDAHRATQRAIEDLTRAREAARERIEDLALATERGALSEERAQISIARAQAELARINADPRASALDKQDASLRLREAELALKEIQERNGDLAKERADSDKKGVEGSDEVVAAKERILDAQRAEADAERALGAARAESARVARDGARDVADAQNRIAEAQRKVADAQQAVIKAQRDHLRAVQALKVEQLQQKAALDQVGSSSGGAATKMAKLSAAERALAKDIKAFQDEYVAWQRSLQPDVFPVIEKGLDVLRVGMDRATPLVKGGAEGLGLFADAAKKALQSKEWTAFFDDLGAKAPHAIEGLGNAAINVAGGLRGVIEAFLPFTGQMTDWVESISQDFEDWGTSLKGSDGFKQFLAYAAEQGPKVAEVLHNIATFAGNLFEAGANVGPGVLDFFVHLSEKIASLDPAQVEAVAKGVGLIFAAMKLGASLKIAGLVALAEVLGSMSPGQIQALAIAIAAVVGAVKGYQIFKTVADFLGGFASKVSSAADVAGGASPKFGALGAVFKGGVIAASVVATAAAFDQVGDAIAGLNPDIADLSSNLVAFGKGGQPAADLLDQIGPKMNGVVGSFETFRDSASRLAGDNPLAKIAEGFTSFVDSNLGIQLDSGRQAIDNLDKSLAATVASGNAEGAAAAFNRLAKQATDAGVPVDKLKELFPQYAASMDGIPATTGDVGQALSTLGGQAGESGRQLGEAAQRMTDFKASVDAFNSQTDAAKGVRDLEKAFNDTKTAVQNAHGVLDLTPGVVGRQRDAVLQARDAFSGLIEKVKGSADAQGALARDTTTARDSVLQQLPALLDLAGKNESARAQVLELAKAYGISGADALKAAKGGQDLVEVLAKLKSKDIHVGADVKPAQDAIDNFVRLNSGRKIPLSVYTKNSQLAAGAIMRYAEGGVQRFAAGGRATPAPHVADSPTILYGEGRAPEAFIPYDPAFRSRAVDLLGQVASDFGLEVFSAQASKKVDSLSGGLKEVQYNVSSGLTDATLTLSQTLGDAGSFTSAVAQVGTVGTQMATAWAAGAQTVSDSVIGVNAAIGISADMIVKSNEKVTSAAITVADAVAKAAAAAVAAAKGGSSNGSSGGGSGKGSQGSVIPPAPSSSLNSSNSVAGDYGLYGLQGNRDAALTNSSRVSAPQRATVVSAGRVASLEGVSANGGSGSGGSGSGGTSVNFYGTTIRESMDADVVTAKIGAVLDSRG
ncbi:hypothetical protein [Nonomuraea sp. NPDC048901]|uniref:hypothetical protein n=1 Tax=Nonomuraea sp. NPDC048901 TaxID=3155627 RepID=UPI0033FCCE0F